MTDTDHADDVEAALATIERRAKDRMRRLRWLLPVIALIGGVVGYGVNRLNPTTHHHHRHHHSAAGLIIGMAIVAVVLVAVAVVVWRMRRRAGLLSYWKSPPLAAGLSRADRRTVRRDLRRCTPNSDPVLRAVEERTAERIRRMQPRWTLWTFPLVCAVMILNAALPGRSESGRVYYGVVAALFVVVGVAGLRQRRALDRFPRGGG